VKKEGKGRRRGNGNEGEGPAPLRKFLDPLLRPAVRVVDSSLSAVCEVNNKINDMYYRTIKRNIFSYFHTVLYNDAPKFTPCKLSHAQICWSSKVNKSVDKIAFQSKENHAQNVT